MTKGDFDLKEVNTTRREEFKPCGDGISNRKFKDAIEPEICTNVLFDISFKDRNNVDKKKLFIRKINCCG